MERNTVLDGGRVRGPTQPKLPRLLWRSVVQFAGRAEAEQRTTPGTRMKRGIVSTKIENAVFPVAVNDMGMACPQVKALFFSSRKMTPVCLCWLRHSND